ncbi:hypothetical protein B0H17DRAFT_1180772, partial [Mycena rosella]
MIPVPDGPLCRQERDLAAAAVCLDFSFFPQTRISRFTAPQQGPRGRPQQMTTQTATGTSTSSALRNHWRMARMNGLLLGGSRFPLILPHHLRLHWHNHKRSPSRSRSRSLSMWTGRAATAMASLTVICSLVVLAVLALSEGFHP